MVDPIRDVNKATQEVKFMPECFAVFLLLESWRTSRPASRPRSQQRKDISPCPNICWHSFLHVSQPLNVLPPERNKAKIVAQAKVEMETLFSKWNGLTAVASRCHIRCKAPKRCASAPPSPATDDQPPGSHRFRSKLPDLSCPMWALCWTVIVQKVTVDSLAESSSLSSALTGLSST